MEIACIPHQLGLTYDRPIMKDWQYQPAKDQGLSPVESWRSLKRESGLASSLARLGWRGFIRLYLSVYHRLAIEGREHLPVKPPFAV